MRGDAVAATCSYASAVNPKTLGSKGAKPTTVDMRGRIDRLETLVRSLISQEASLDILDGYGSNPSLVERLSKKGHVALQGINSNNAESTNEGYDLLGGQKISLDTRSTHWDAILHDVSITNPVLTIRK